MTNESDREVLEGTLNRLGIDIAVCSDVSGLTSYNGKNYLVLGKATNPDCDLDEYWSDGKRWRFEGFKEFNISYIVKTLTSLDSEATREIGFQIPLNFKRLAARAGIGNPGKNGLIIHSKHKASLRFKVVEIGEKSLELLSMLERPVIIEEPKQYEGCRSCNSCIDVCNALKINTGYNIADRTKCSAYIQLESPTSAAQRCNICTSLCT